MRAPSWYDRLVQLNPGSVGLSVVCYTRKERSLCAEDAVTTDCLVTSIT